MIRRNQQENPTKVHRWLSRHKIIFETVAVFIFTVATIVVAVLQWQTAARQEDISRRQVQPNFLVSIHRVKQADETFFSDEEMHIQNLGGPAKEPNSTIAVWYEVELFKEGRSVKSRIPVTWYYTGTAVTSDKVNGLLFRSSGHHNNLKATELEKAVHRLAKERGYDICSIKMRQFVRLNYLDLFNEDHLDYMEVHRIFGGRQISEKEGDELVDAHMVEFERSGFDFSEGSAEDLLKRCKTLQPSKADSKP